MKNTPMQQTSDEVRSLFQNGTHAIASIAMEQQQIVRCRKVESGRQGEGSTRTKNKKLHQ